MTPDCLRLDDYLDGRLSEPESEAFETHTVTCAECDAALYGALAIDGLASLRDETCPPAVVTAALRSARRAPDRPAVPMARRSRSRLSLVVLALTAAVAVVIGVTRVGAPDTPTLADADPPVSMPTEDLAPEPESTEPESTGPGSTEPAPLAESRATEAAAQPPAPAPALPDTPAVAPRAPTPPPPVASEVTSVPDDTIAQNDATSDDAPTAEDIAGAQRDVALAFSLIAEAQTRAGAALRSRAGPVSATIDQALPF